MRLARIGHYPLPTRLDTPLKVTPLWQRTIAVGGLTCTSPLTLLAALAIKVSSHGPVLYKAERVGRDGRTFVMFKLRTMSVGGSGDAVITAGKDSRVFPVGRALRRLKLDELPQLVNVAKGEMSLVGPRPEVPEIVEQYQPWMRETLGVPPGIVGSGSLGYFLEESAIPEVPESARNYYLQELLPRKLARDLVYVRNRSLWYDFYLLLRAGLGVVGASRLARRAAEREDMQAYTILRELEAGGL